MLDNFR